MEGFFTKEEITSTTSPDGRSYTCISCGRFKDANTPRLEIGGGFEKKILIVGETTSAEQDRNPSAIPDGVKLLSDILEGEGINLKRDCYVINSNRCYSEKSVTTYNIDCCRKNIIKVIEDKKPKLILLLGENALYSVIGIRWKKNIDPFNKWTDWVIPDQDLKTWLAPIYSPSYVIEKENNKVIKKVWENNIKKALSHLDIKFPVHKPTIISFLKDDLSVLNEINSGLVSIDYETTGIKPYSEGHRIVCASVAISDKLAYSFLIPKTRKQREPFLNLLRNENVGKMAHNMKYEDTWSAIRLKTEVVNWKWDSMLAAHVLDNRPGTKGLKFQTYVNLGIVDYDSEIEPYLKSDKTTYGENGKNRIEECLQNEQLTKLLLTYCANDTCFQYRIALKQMESIDPVWLKEIKKDIYGNKSK